MNKNDKIYIAGHTGRVGSMLMYKLRKLGYRNLLLRTHSELDLINQYEVETFFQKEKPQYAFYCCSSFRKGNNELHKIIYDNLMMQANFIHSAINNNVKKLIYVGSGAVYGPNLENPFLEDKAIWSIQQAREMEPYAVAKISGLELCKQYDGVNNCECISILPTHIYGSHTKNQDIIGECMLKIVKAKQNQEKTVQLDIWGTGEKTIRQFIYIDDLVEYMIYLMKDNRGVKTVNVAYDEELSWHDIVMMIKEFVGYEGEIRYLIDKPERGNKRILSLENMKNTGFVAKYSMKKGLKDFYNNYIFNIVKRK